jgi:drug/metabolite transporter (DMT)-like permease
VTPAVPDDAGPDRRWLGVALAAGGTLVLSTESVVLRAVASGDAAPGRGTIVCLVGLLTALTATGISVLRHGLTPSARSWRRGGAPLWWAGALQGASTVSFVVAISLTSVADVVVVLAAAPLATALVALVWLGERPSRPVWVGIVVSTVGVAVVASGTLSGGAIAGVLAALGAIAAFACSVAVLRGHRGLDRTLVVAVAGASMSVAAAPFARPGELDVRALYLLVLLGVVIGPCARWMLSSAPRHLPAAQVGLFVPIETVAATLWAYLAFDEVPASTTWLGATLVLGGVVVAVLQPGLRPRTASSPPRGSAMPPPG